MASYVVPQVEIHQLFSEIPVSLTQNQVPFIFGPNFILHTKELSEEFEGEEYIEDSPSMSSSSDPTRAIAQFFEFPNVYDQEKIDHSSIKVYANNAIIALMSTEEDIAKATAGTAIEIEVKGDDSISLSGVSEDFKDECTVGRHLRLVKGVGVAASSSSSTREVSASEKGWWDVIITKVEVNEDDGSLLITFNEEITEDDAPGGFDLVIICEVQSEVQITPEDFTDDSKERMQWTVGKNPDDEAQLGILLQNTTYVSVNDPDVKKLHKYGQLLAADIYISYRELTAAASDTIHSITGASEVANMLGTVHPDNPLAQAVYNAALNAGGQIVRYMAVETNDVDGYDKVLNAASLTKDVYFLVPVTVGLTPEVKQQVLDRVQSHVGAMSAPTSKRWRIAFVSADIPNEDPIYTKEANTDGSDFLATCFAVSETDKTADIMFVVPNGQDYVESPDTRCKKDLNVKDILRIDGSEEYGKKTSLDFRIVKILSNSRIRISDPNGIFATGGDPDVVEVYHQYTNAQKAEVIRNISSNFADRRMYNVFPSEFKGSGVTQQGEFAAACVAGLVSSCLPQQPVTNLELNGIDDIPLVYQTFSYDELNTIASGGTFIVMQDLPNDQVYVRHQISTDYESNNLNTAELSVTKNLDSISYYFDDLLSPYIGKYNITPELLLVIRNVITAGLTSLESTDYGLYGPQVIAEGTDILLLEQDALLKDHVNCNLQLNLPYPFNRLVLKLFV